MNRHPRIHLIAGGMILLQQDHQRVYCWDWQERRLLYRLPGYFVGAARDGHSFLLEAYDDSIQAIEARSGASIPLESIAAQDYAPGQRCALRLTRHVLEVRDVLGDEIVHAIELTRFERDPHAASFSAACIAPEGDFLALTLSGDSMFGEWARGYCLDSQEALRFTFSASPSPAHPKLRMSARGRYLLVEASIQHYSLWDMQADEGVADYPIQAPGYIIAMNDEETPPIVVLQDASNHLEFHQGRTLLGRRPLEDPADDGVFLPDQRQLALLLDSNEIALYDWRANVQNGRFRLP